MTKEYVAEDEKQLLYELAAALTERGWMCGTAESCTGGLIGAAMTSLPGSSGWFRGGVISYANEVKSGVLGVPAVMIEEYGAVSEPVARAMADGACRVLDVDIAVSVTGIAGPEGGTPEKPVGTVWIGWATKGDGGNHRTELFRFSGNREEIRLLTRKSALAGLVDLLRQI